MIKLKDILDEKLSVDVQWVSKAYTFAKEEKFPLTPTIGAILNKKQRVRAFHVTSPTNKYIDNITSLQGSKKSISCMTKLPTQVTDRLHGVWQDGLLFYLEGTLVIKSTADIMTEPDEQGRRWFSLEHAGFELEAEWIGLLRKDKTYKSLQSKIVKLIIELYSLNARFRTSIARSRTTNARPNSKAKKEIDKKTIELNELYRQIIKRVVDLAEPFAKKNKKIILKKLMSNWGSPWDELILNEIELIDAIYDVRKVKNKKTIENKLKSIVSGNVYSVDTADSTKASTKIRSFVSKRGVKSI